MIQHEKWVRWAAITVTAAGVLLALYLFFDVVLMLLLPFLFAFLLAALTHPLAARFARRTGLPQGAVAATFTLLALFLLGALVYLLFASAVVELQRFLALASDETSELSQKFAAFSEALRALLARLPAGFSGIFSFATDIIGDPEEFFATQLRGFLSRLGEALPQFVAGVLRALPRVLFFLLITLIACFYFSVEYTTVTAALRRLLPPKMGERLPAIGRRIRQTGGRYVAAYGLLFLITFGELLLGLLLLRAEYVLLPALLIALLDLLPIFGVGVALVPWGIFALFVGNTVLGVGLLVLYAVITVVRQIVEPHIVGKTLGLHPILMLMGLYAGLSLFGVVGAVAGPLLLLVLKLLLGAREQKNE